MAFFTIHNFFNSLSFTSCQSGKNTVSCHVWIIFNKSSSYLFALHSPTRQNKIMLQSHAKSHETKCNYELNEKCQLLIWSLVFSKNNFSILTKPWLISSWQSINFDNIRFALIYRTFWRGHQKTLKQSSTLSLVPLNKQLCLTPFTAASDSVHNCHVLQNKNRHFGSTDPFIAM